MEEEIKIKIIPELIPSIDLSHGGDTLVVTIDQEKWTISQAQTILDQMREFFPNNNVIGLCNGVELKVIHNSGDNE